MLQHFFFNKQDVGSIWKKIDLNWLACNYRTAFGEFEKNPFLDPKFCERVIYFWSLMNCTDNSFGGYMECRAEIWKGSYLRKDNSIHLGIDYNVSTGIKVYCPVNAEIVDDYSDTDQNGGWGRRLTLKYSKGYFVLGHLGTVNLSKGSVGAGECLGTIGESSVNGGWYPHLHVQCMREFKDDFDGYSSYYDGISEDYPNPEIELIEEIRRQEK